MKITRWIAWIAAVLACGVVLAAWGNPHLSVELSNFIQTCF